MRSFMGGFMGGNSATPAKYLQMQHFRLTRHRGVNEMLSPTELAALVSCLAPPRLAAQAGSGANTKAASPGDAAAVIFGSRSVCGQTAGSLVRGVRLDRHLGVLFPDD